MKEKYDLSFEEAQALESKTGLDVYSNDGDIFINRDNITRTIGNVLQFGIDYQKAIDDKAMDMLNEACDNTIKLEKSELIRKACEWWYVKLNELYPNDLLGEVVDAFHKAMEE